MSVATKNPFALLEAEGASRPSSPVSVPAAQAPPAPPASTRGSQRPGGGPASRAGKYYTRGGANKQPSKDSNPNQDGVEEPVIQEGQRRYENRGRGRSGRGANVRGGRRPFDKHSQTGKTDSDKKIQQSWGGADGNTERKNEEEATADAAVEENTEWGTESAPTADWGAPVATTDANTETVPTDAERPEGGRPRRDREPEEEDNTLTLDQYIAQQKEKDSVIPKLEGTRQANEGADASIWKDVVPLSKEGEDTYFVGKTKSAPKARAKKEEKVFLEIDARFERPDRGGRGRGGRGGDRGRSGNRGRGGGRGGRQPDTPTVNIDDPSAFPSLP